MRGKGQGGCVLADDNLLLRVSLCWLRLGGHFRAYRGLRESPGQDVSRLSALHVRAAADFM